jgi:hypothetical protein
MGYTIFLKKCAKVQYLFSYANVLYDEIIKLSTHINYICLINVIKPLSYLPFSRILIESGQILIKIDFHNPNL